MAMTKTDTLNYRGELFLVGQYKTPLLRAIAGSSKRSAAFVFPMGQSWQLASASQPSISEDTSVTAGTPTTIARTEFTNTAQIFKYDVSVSFKKQSTFGSMSGVNTNDPNPVVDELSFQKTAQLRQMAIDMEYSFLNGTYANASTTGTAATTRGIITGITTNAVAASSAKLSKDLIDSVLRLMANSGSPFGDPVFLVGAFQKQQISNIYGYVPDDRNLGGLNIKQVETDFGIFSVIYDPYVPAGTLLVADLSVIAPVFVPVTFTEGTGIQMNAEGLDVMWQPTAVTAAGMGGFFYSQAGIDYGPETYHGKITGLATA